MKNIFVDLSVLEKHMRLYNACGNIIGIAPLAYINYRGDFRKDRTLRTFLHTWGGKNNCDSIMVLTGSPLFRKSRGYHVSMDVFEPKGTDNSGLPGGVSTMCGNGLRAVAHFLEELVGDISNFQVMTKSGMRNIVKKEHDLYQVNMGRFFSKASVLSRYITPGKLKSKHGYFVDSQIPQDIKRLIGKYISAQTWSIGLNGSYDKNGNIDGEPHVVIFLNEKIKTVNTLRKIAIKVGPLITKHTALFPFEVNVNFAVINPQDKNNVSVLLCTHERNLGNDPKHSVTAACGTGSTVVGALLFEKLRLTNNQSVTVNLLGGDLTIHKNEENLFMTGSVVSLL